MIYISIAGRVAHLLYCDDDGNEIRQEAHMLDSLEDLRDALNLADCYDDAPLDGLPLFGPEPPEDCGLAWYSCDAERVLLYDADADQWYVEAYR